jgi:hypothetical protein
MFEKLVVQARGPKVSLLAGELDPKSPFHDSNEISDGEVSDAHSGKGKDQFVEAGANVTEIFNLVNTLNKNKGKSNKTTGSMSNAASGQKVMILENAEVQLREAQRLLGLLPAAFKAGK